MTEASITSCERALFVLATRNLCLGDLGSVFFYVDKRYDGACYSTIFEG